MTVKHAKFTEAAKANVFRYRTYIYDEDLGMYYLHNRYYDPQVGRFISEDPAKDGTNWYAYCNGDCVNYVDPTGLWAQVGDTIWEAQRGDTLWGLSEIVYGNGSLWTTFGYQDSHRNLQVGEIIDVTGRGRVGRNMGSYVEFYGGGSLFPIVDQMPTYTYTPPAPAPSKPSPPAANTPTQPTPSNPQNNSTPSTSSPGNGGSGGNKGGGFSPSFGLGKDGKLPEVVLPPKASELYVPPVNIFFVYDEYDGDFREQATYMAEKKYRNQINQFIYVLHDEDFINGWNNLVGTRINDILLFIHGGVGHLYFYNKESMGYDDFSRLEKLNIEGRAYLLACHGGTEYEGSTIAWKFSELLHGKRVRAVVDGKVYYRSYYQIFRRWPLTKEEGAYWADFYYVRGLTSRRKLKLEGGFYKKMPWPA